MLAALIVGCLFLALLRALHRIPPPHRGTQRCCLFPGCVSVLRPSLPWWIHWLRLIFLRGRSLRRWGFLRSLKRIRVVWATTICRRMSPKLLYWQLVVVAPLSSVMAGFFSFFMALSMLTLNCNGIRDQSKRAGLVQWLRSLPVGADIVCLQETHCLSAAECSSWFFSSGFSAVGSSGSSHSCGCIVLFRPSLSLVNSWCDVSGRHLQVEFSFFGKSFRVVCV